MYSKEEIAAGKETYDILINQVVRQSRSNAVRATMAYCRDDDSIDDNPWYNVDILSQAVIVAALMSLNKTTAAAVKRCAADILKRERAELEAGDFGAFLDSAMGLDEKPVKKGASNAKKKEENKAAPDKTADTEDKSSP